MEQIENGKGEGKASNHKNPSMRTLVKEAEPKGEKISYQEEASLALLCLQGNPPLEDVDQDLEGEDVEDEIPKMLAHHASSYSGRSRISLP
ncbi:hypothetical protein GOP47_0005518 [Adiantum capillus-veneris]|uniref:Uncharacterized protein n=1 Tax=Adiantum capillus-veneris TaxID=13818 RepID=A0A9D4V5A0_ADICA|nr:hypothetical protein GOP47_0005518 [Adiantum capillus-veneris]